MPKSPRNKYSEQQMRAVVPRAPPSTPRETRPLDYNEERVRSTIDGLHDTANRCNSMHYWMSGKAQGPLEKTFKGFRKTLIDMEQKIRSMCRHSNQSDIDGKYYNGKEDIWRYCNVCHEQIGRVCEESPIGLCEFPDGITGSGADYRASLGKNLGYNRYVDYVDLAAHNKKGKSKKSRTSRQSPTTTKTVNFHGANIVPGPNPPCKHCGRTLNQEIEELVIAEAELDNIQTNLSNVSKTDRKIIKAFQKEVERLDEPYGHIEPG